MQSLINAMSVTKTSAIDEVDMSTSQAIHTTSPVIAHATDLHPEGGVAFRHGVALAHQMGASLHTIYADVSGEDAKRPMPDAQALLMRWMLPEPAASGFAHHTHHEGQCCEDVIESILTRAKQLEPDLLIVGTHQHKGLVRLFRQSVAESLALNLVVPTLFIPILSEGFVKANTGESGLRRIMIPTLRETDVLSAVAMVVWLLESLELTDVEITLLHVGEEPVQAPIKLPQRPGWSWQRAQAKGPLVETLIEVASERETDLIVMSTHGHDSVLDIFRGSYTEQVVRESAIPVLSVPTQPKGQVGQIMGQLTIT